MLMPFLSHSNFSRPLQREEYKACVKNVPIDMSKVSYHVNDCEQDGSTPKYVCMFLCVYVCMYVYMNLLVCILPVVNLC